MGTESVIAIVATDNKPMRAIRVHWDGQLSGVGKILNDHYMIHSKVEDLISHGHASAIYENVNPTGPHSFDNREPGCSIFYHRDRKEKLRIDRIKSIRDLRSWAGVQYIYIWVGHTWMVSVNNSKFFPLGSYVDFCVEDDSELFRGNK